MQRLGSGNGRTGLVVASSVFAVDQASKVMAAHGGAGYVPRNPDYAFGIIGGSAAVLVLAALVVLAGFLVVAHLLAARFGISVFLPALVAGGTIGNTIDRVRLGSVRDFLVTPWAIINVADLAVAAGVIGLTIALARRVPRLRTELATTRVR